MCRARTLLCVCGRACLCACVYASDHPSRDTLHHFQLRHVGVMAGVNPAKDQTDTVLSPTKNDQHSIAGNCSRRRGQFAPSLALSSLVCLLALVH